MRSLRMSISPGTRETRCSWVIALPSVRTTRWREMSRRLRMERRLLVGCRRSAGDELGIRHTKFSAILEALAQPAGRIHHRVLQEPRDHNGQAQCDGRERHLAVDVL